MNILLNNRLSDDLLGWGSDSLGSVLSVVFGWFSDWVHFDGLVLLSVEFDLDIFSLNNRLYISLVDDLSSWSSNSL